MRRLLARTAFALGIVVLLAASAFVGRVWYDSRLPSAYAAMDFATVDYGRGPAVHHSGHTAVSVADLTGPQTARPDLRVTLRSKKAKIRLASGRTIDAWTFNGQVPGPELRVRQGGLVEVTLVNDDIDEGVSIHWHGVDVPNGEDGVAGVTQDAVMPGGRHVYRFRAEQVGTFWYHSHQVSSTQVRRGLYGAFVIERRMPRRGVDLTLVAHDFNGRAAFGLSDVRTAKLVHPGTPVRLRLINTNSAGERVIVAGAPFRVVAIDGTDVNGPTPIEDKTLLVGGGARYDVFFVMPDYSVAVRLDGSSTGFVLHADASDRQIRSGGPVDGDFDPATYGRPKPTVLGSTTRFDREFVLDIGKKVGFIDGRPGYHWSVNGKLFPHTPMFMVRRGDLVKVRIVNNTGSVHPMHLHGHHVLVLSRNGRRATGSPWWVDTLNVERDAEYEVAFVADNPGIWMDHCHNLGHAADGLTMHVAYEGVTTPFRIGGDGHNHPE
jgi:FtsP/CotA-like multicopper oxidase with cupredoxin domain